MSPRDLSPDDAELTKVEGGWLTADRFLSVEDEDIAHGRRRDQWACAVVRAIQRRYPNAVRVRVNAKLIGFSIDEVRYTYPTPPEMVETVIRPFDTDQPIEAHTFKLRGGKMRDVTHMTGSAAVERRQRQRGRPVSDRQKQMSPAYHEYERFTE